MSRNDAAELPDDDELGTEPDRNPDEQPDPKTLAARVRTLQAENERLREAVSTAQKRRYRYTALGLAVVGGSALLGAVLLSTVRTVLFALGATGIFGAILTYFLTPERFVSATVGQRVYGTLADNEAAIVEDLALRGDPVVVPTGGSTAPARLFVPQLSDQPTPDGERLRTPFVTGDATGLAFEPTGSGLYETLADATGTLPETAGGVAATVGDALVEQFELVDGVDVDATEVGRVTMAVDGSAYGPVDRFDHPVASLLATALAVELETEVTVTVDDAERADWLVTCRYDA